MKLKIADITIEIICEHPISAFAEFENFLTSSKQSPALTVTIEALDCIPKPQDNICLDDENKWILHGQENLWTTVYRCSNNDSENNVIFKVEVDGNWQNASVSYVKGSKAVEQEVAVLIGHILLKNRILFFKGLVIHAAAIVDSGRGILFTAPSGTGKSTQAKLWSSNRDAVIINDDTPAVRVIANQAQVYGTPWSGSHQIFTNISAPISALIVIEQSENNSIRKISTKESIPMLLPRCFMPYHDDRLMHMACENLERIVKSTHCYHMKCTQDEEAIEVVLSCLK